MLLEKHFTNLDERGKAFLGIIHSSVQEMLKLIENLLAFSVSGKQQVESSDINLNEVARAVLEELKGAASERTLEVNVGMLPSAWGDQRMIRQVLTNLISNAIKFTGPREVAIIEVGGHVRDKGIGFDSESSDKWKRSWTRHCPANHP